MSYRKKIDPTGGWDKDINWVREQQAMFDNPESYGLYPGERFTLPLYLKQQLQSDLPGDIERAERRI